MWGPDDWVRALDPPGGSQFLPEHSEDGGTHPVRLREVYTSSWSAEGSIAMSWRRWPVCSLCRFGKSSSRDRKLSARPPGWPLVHAGHPPGRLALIAPSISFGAWTAACAFLVRLFTASFRPLCTGLQALWGQGFVCLVLRCVPTAYDGVRPWSVLGDELSGDWMNEPAPFQHVLGQPSVSVSFHKTVAVCTLEACAPCRCSGTLLSPPPHQQGHRPWLAGVQRRSPGTPSWLGCGGPSGSLLLPVSETRRLNFLIWMAAFSAGPSVLLKDTGLRLKPGNVLKSIFSRSKGRGLTAADVT